MSLENEINKIKSWDEFNLKNNLLRGIYSYGFENPSPIQQKAIQPIINKYNVVTFQDFAVNPKFEDALKGTLIATPQNTVSSVGLSELQFGSNLTEGIYYLHVYDEKGVIESIQLVKL